MSDDCGDFLDDLRDELWWKQSNWIRTPTVKCRFAIMPQTATDPESWERSNVQVHIDQERAGPLMIEERPTENMLLRKRERLRRGD